MSPRRSRILDHPRSNGLGAFVTVFNLAFFVASVAYIVTQ